MHNTSLRLMQRFVADYLNPRQNLKILDVGSQSVNGDYRSIFINPLGWWEYVGLDVSIGQNVDIVANDQYKWPLNNASFDVIISGQCLEHVEAPWLWIKEVERVCKPGGVICIIAPAKCTIHRYPVDCWRILPDGITYLLEQWCSFKVLECEVVYDIEIDDCYTVAYLRGINESPRIVLPGYGGSTAGI